MTTKPTRWLAYRLGRRGAALAVLGAIFVLVGLDVLLAPAAPDHDRFLLHTFIPSPLMAALWIIPGALALRASFHKGPGNDGFGFMALVVPLILRIVSYVFSFLAFLFGAGSWPFGWASALIWLAILALILIIAGWAEVPSGYKPRPRTRRRWR
ncbi:membrane protein [Arthrobacter phage Crewmate]|uniref:Membrane protein n=1 Tax=Arthrobacter phage Crewmate TaxID=2832317 RepID=A0AA48Y3M6_9CAUD|nr:membrane protein [Arthrobacter phage Crewmate]UIW13274.1 membrane protein [Arthrobacter phage Crewmate]WGH21197.1 membrane protein [Arthrobacter phage ObiToo]